VLLLVATPLAYVGVVLIGVTAGVVFASGVRRASAGEMDADQVRAFGNLRLPVVGRVAGVLVETLCQALAFVLQLAHRLRLLPAPAPRPEHTPVVVLPGYTENSGTTWWLGRRLARAGFNAVLLDFPSTLRRIEDNADFLAERIAEIRARHGGKQVAVVAHSMGGLVTRALVHRNRDHGVLALAAVASPFRGTALASLSRYLPLGRSVRQMRPGSPFLASFPPSLALPLPLLSLVGRQETIVCPEWSVVIEGAQVRALERAYGHITPLFLALAFTEIEGFLLGHGVTREHG
jgi:pimeloyl-ACP methyl ester carboxylesterase